MSPHLRYNVIGHVIGHIGITYTAPDDFQANKCSQFLKLGSRLA
jgi:hypothetical protein